MIRLLVSMGAILGLAYIIYCYYPNCDIDDVILQIVECIIWLQIFSTICGPYILDICMRYKKNGIKIYDD